MRNLKFCAQGRQSDVLLKCLSSSLWEILWTPELTRHVSSPDSTVIGWSDSLRHWVVLSVFSPHNWLEHVSWHWAQSFGQRRQHQVIRNFHLEQCWPIWGLRGNGSFDDFGKNLIVTKYSLKNMGVYISGCRQCWEKKIKNITWNQLTQKQGFSRRPQWMGRRGQ